MDLRRRDNSGQALHRAHLTGLQLVALESPQRGRRFNYLAHVVHPFTNLPGDWGLPKSLNQRTSV